ncbi:MAG: hypothetical protein ICV51_10050 [Flavisolibacter sp.]|nr:hypothetical protein [Flavisolibacter sp.]MBD0351137.1 hypothetical protein [Flavisolibacter sp.]MBD0375957.1 hypothetical protein [Flavisolibacter sp.]
MLRNQQTVSAQRMAMLLSVIANAVVLRNAFIMDEQWYWALVLTVPMLLFMLMDKRKGIK